MTDEADSVTTLQHSAYVWENSWNKSAIVCQHWNANVEFMDPVNFSDHENLKMLIPWQMEARKIHPHRLLMYVRDKARTMPFMESLLIGPNSLCFP